MRSWLYIIILCVSPLYTIAQQAIPDSSAQNSATQIEVEPEENPFGMLEMFSGNPGKAALYSLIFPGAGQYYNTKSCLLYTSPSPRDGLLSRMPSSA